MNPNACLEQLLVLARAYVAMAYDEDSLDPVDDGTLVICERVLDLDRWIREGYHLPEAWTQSVTGRPDE